MAILSALADGYAEDRHNHNYIVTCQGIIVTFSQEHHTIVRSRLQIVIFKIKVIFAKNESASLWNLLENYNIHLHAILNRIEFIKTVDMV